MLWPAEASLSKRDRGLVSLQTWSEDAAGLGAQRSEEVVVEEPLEIRVAGERLTLTMRTPGDDRELALGFLFAEGVIAGLEDVGSVYPCGRSDDPSYGNVLEVTPGPGARLTFEPARRDLLTSSACGVCGRIGIEDLLARLQTRRPAGEGRLSAQLLRRVPELIARGQARFPRTGGLHAACALSEQGEVLAAAEDVGRHNAVDKVVGRLLYQGQLPVRTAQTCLLAVSGRASFEIVQKAAVAGFIAVASISAPSSLAVATAEAAGLCLAAFVREGRFTLYAHRERVVH